MHTSIRENIDKGYNSSREKLEIYNSKVSMKSYYANVEINYYMELLDQSHTNMRI